MERQELRKDWYVRVASSDIDPAKPGIYEWRIEGVGVYIGKAKKLRSRAREYIGNLRLMVNGLPYRIPSRDFRDVHYGLLRGYRENLAVTLTFLENCSLELRREREDHWITIRRKEASEGGLPILNSN